LNPSLRDKILRSPFLPIIVFPFRLKLVFRHLTYQGRLGAMWLFRSKEFANFTYDLTPANKDYLAWFVSGVCNVPVQQIKKYFLELESNVDLKEHIATRLRANRRGKEIDGQAFFGRRLGWYAIVRATKPNVIVETGTEKGLGSLVLAEALLRNNRGRLVTIDIEPQSGLLIGGKWARVVEQVIEDSLVALNNIDNIDLFIHDSDHSADHEFRELESVVSHLSADGTVLSDNSHVTSMLADWSLKHNRLFLFFAEKPLNHWYPGAGIGVSVKRPTISQISKERP
jgi:predicted O-methyltransferase YrrM